jgi:large subunit ribosomal protein L10
MSLFIKNQIQNDYEKKFDGVTEFVVIDTTGISGLDNNLFRGEMKKKNMHLSVVKNSLMRLALKKKGMENAGQVFQSGPCVVVYGGDSVIDVAKEVLVWGKKFKAIKPKGAYVDGCVMKGDNAVAALSKMPTRAELQGQIVQIALTPGSTLASAILSPGSAIAGCLKTMIENKEKEAA